MGIFMLLAFASETKLFFFSCTLTTYRVAAMLSMSVYLEMQREKIQPLIAPCSWTDQ